LTLGLGAAGLVWHAVRRGYRNWTGAGTRTAAWPSTLWRAVTSYANAIALLVAVLLIPVMVFVNGHVGNTPQRSWRLRSSGLPRPR